MWTLIRSARWSDRLVSRPVSESGSGRCRRPDLNRPKRLTERGSSTKERRPSRTSKPSCLIWWDGFHFLFALHWFLFAAIMSNFFIQPSKKKKVTQCIKRFLSSQVRSSDAAWSDTRRNLRKDHRWESASLLEREEKEKLFNEHVEALAKKKKEQFRQLLDETSMVRQNTQNKCIQRSSVWLFWASFLF